MSSFYVSSCCGAQVSQIDLKNNIGLCMDCHEWAELEAEIDNH